MSTGELPPGNKKGCPWGTLTISLYMQADLSFLTFELGRRRAVLKRPVFIANGYSVI